MAKLAPNLVRGEAGGKSPKATPTGRRSVLMRARSVAFAGLDSSRGRHWDPWQVDRKDASLIGDIPGIDPAVVRFNPPSAEGKAKPQTGSIGASLLESVERFDVVPTRKAAAFVLHLDDNPVGAGTGPQRNGGSAAGEFERVLQQVSHHCREDLSIGLDRHVPFGWLHRERDAIGTGLQGCGRHELVDE